MIFTLDQTTPTVAVTIPDDTVVESSETFALIVQRNASDPATTLAKPTSTIMDNDVLATTYSITPNPVSVNEGAGTQTLHGHALGRPASGDGLCSTAQYRGLYQQWRLHVHPEPGRGLCINQTTATVTVSITNDAVVESNETFALLVQRNTSDPTSTYLAKTAFTIVDNDVLATTYSITPNPVSVKTGAGTQTFTVTRSGGLPAETVYASTAQTEGFTNSGDYTSILNQGVVFALNQTTATVTVSITNDAVVESNETFALLVQRNTSDPTSTYLAKTAFTIVDDNGCWPPPTRSRPTRSRSTRGRAPDPSRSRARAACQRRRSMPVRRRPRALPTVAITRPS